MFYQISSSGLGVRKILLESKSVQQILLQSVRSDQSNHKEAKFYFQLKALHYMSPNALYAEAFRVLRPGGVLAVAGYHFSRSRPSFNLQDLTSCHSHCHLISCVVLKILFLDHVSKGILLSYFVKICCFRPDNQELQEAFDTVYEVQLLLFFLLSEGKYLFC